MWVRLIISAHGIIIRCLSAMGAWRGWTLHLILIWKKWNCLVLTARLLPTVFWLIWIKRWCISILRTIVLPCGFIKMWRVLWKVKWPCLKELGKNTIKRKMISFLILRWPMKKFAIILIRLLQLQKKWWIVAYGPFIILVTNWMIIVRCFRLQIYRVIRKYFGINSMMEIRLVIM